MVCLALVWHGSDRLVDMWGWYGMRGGGMVGGIGPGVLERCDMLYRVVAGLSRGDGLSVFEQL